MARHYLGICWLAALTIFLSACGVAAPPAAPTAAAAPMTAPKTTGTTPGASAPAATSAGARVKVRTGYVPVFVYSPLFIGVEKGYFAAEGLDVELSPAVGGSDIVVQLSSGNFDVAAGGAGAALFNAAKQGIKFKIVAPLHAEAKPLSTPLVVSKKAFDSGKYTKVADLKGKKVAVNAAGSATEYWLQAALQKAGLSIKDVDFQALPFNDVPAALESGALDGSMLGEPLATLSEQKGLIHRLSDDFLDGFQPTVVYYSIDFATKQPAAADAFMRAYLKACRDLEGDGYKDDTNAKIIEKYTKVPAEVVKVASHPFHEPNGRVNVKDLQTLQDFFMSRGELTYKDMLDIASYYDPSFADRAVKMLGEYKAK